MNALYCLLPLAITVASLVWAIYWPMRYDTWMGWTVLIARLFAALIISLLVWIIASFTHWGMA